MGCKDQLLPPNPEELTQLLREYLGEQLCKVYMIHNEGNEWQKPEAATLVNELSTNLKRLIHDRSVAVGQNDATTGFLEFIAESVYSTKIAPGLKSLLSDVNQLNEPLMHSRIDDLNTVLTIPAPR